MQDISKNNLKALYGTRWVKNASQHFKVPAHTIKYWFTIKKPDLLEYLVEVKKKHDADRSRREKLIKKLGIDND